ncbi:MFS general substrate transporter [Thozetella sp. PMI_491]|nr:MFS general substrate transporter [Thozetella sp. PMI_491]
MQSEHLRPQGSDQRSPASSSTIEKPIVSPRALENAYENQISRRLTEVQVEQALRTHNSLAEFDESQLPRLGAVDHDIKGSPLNEHTKGWRWWLICFAVYMSCLIYGLDTTIAADVQGAVTDTFNQVTQVAWLGAGFLLGSTASILPYGALYNHFNMKWLYIWGIILFEAGSALCGAAPTMDSLIVGRVIAGVGGTGIFLGGLNYMTALTSEKERGIYITAIGFSWGVGCILGPIVGGSFSDSSATWRWAFYINLVIAALTAPIYLFMLPPIQPSQGVSTRDRLARFDYLGFILSIAFWVAFSLGLLSAGGIWPWNDGRTIATITVAGVLLVAYALQQSFSLFTTPETRSFPVHLLKSRTQVLLYITSSAAMVGQYVPIFYIPIYFQFVRNDTALEAAVRLLSFIVLVIFSNLASGYLLPKVNYYIMIYLVAGVLLTLAGALYYVYLTPETPASTIYGLNIIGGIGAGLGLQVGFSIATLKAHPKDAVHAITMQNFGQLGAGVFGLVIAGQVFQNAAIRNLSAVLSPAGYTDAQIQEAAAGAQSPVLQGLPGDLKSQAISAITEAIRQDFILVIVAGAVLLVAGGAMRREKLFK